MQNAWSTKLISFIVISLLVLGSFFSEFSSAAVAPRCEQILAAPANEKTSETTNKYEKLAQELGLTYLKAPLPAGYRRQIISSRTYYKKDGSEGKTIHYYRYFRPDGQIIRPRIDVEDYEAIKAQFKELNIADNWSDVWVSPDESTHIQVLAKDLNGKAISIYHDEWESGSSRAKFDRVMSLGASMNSYRRHLIKQVKDPSLSKSSKEKTESLALLLLLTGRIRVGDIKYLNENGTTGVTTLTKDQVVIAPNGTLLLTYIGKAGNKNPEQPVFTNLEITDPVLKENLIALKSEHPEDPRLFIYENPKASANDNLIPCTDHQLNLRLQEWMQKSRKQTVNNRVYTVKDLRTWAATVKTVEELVKAGPPPTEPPKMDKILKAISIKVSRLLNNTPAVARKNYIDPRLLNADAYEVIWNYISENYPQLLISKKGTNESSLEFDTRFEKVIFELPLTQLNKE